MANEMTAIDARQLYLNVLTKRKGRIIKVRKIIDGHPMMVQYFDLKTRKQYTLEFKPEDFKPFSGRIGYINMSKRAYYIARRPKRIYYNGLHADNIVIKKPSGVDYGKDWVDKEIKIMELEDPSIYAAYVGKYPTLSEAIVLAQKWMGVCAFDKQFAVSHSGVVYYKNQTVGEIVDGSIQFTSTHSYLNSLIGENYEKTSRTFASKTI